MKAQLKETPKGETPKNSVSSQVWPRRYPTSADQPRSIRKDQSRTLVTGAPPSPYLKGKGGGGPQFHLYSLPHKRENGTTNGIPGVTPWSPNSIFEGVPYKQVKQPPTAKPALKSFLFGHLCSAITCPQLNENMISELQVSRVGLSRKRVNQMLSDFHLLWARCWAVELFRWGNHRNQTRTWTPTLNKRLILTVSKCISHHRKSPTE